MYIYHLFISIYLSIYRSIDRSIYVLFVYLYIYYIFIYLFILHHIQWVKNHKENASRHWHQNSICPTLHLHPDHPVLELEFMVRCPIVWQNSQCYFLPWKKKQQPQKISRPWCSLKPQTVTQTVLFTSRASVPMSLKGDTMTIAGAEQNQNGTIHQ